MTDRQAEPVSGTATRAWRPRRRVVVWGAVGLALIAGLVVWLLVRGDGSDEGAPTVPVGRPVAMSDAQLRAFGRAQATPVYWAGARANTTYELTRSAGGHIYIRYLPAGVRLGDPRAQYLTVGTYPQQNAYAVLTAAGRRKGYAARTTASGALIVYRRRQHPSVYFTFPNAAFQVETYEPRPGRALATVLNGGVVQLR
jgi:hypothetical protein